jgi:dihydrofolate reductase
MVADMDSVKASVFIGVSVDGFIARLNGDLDFLPADGGEPHGYNEFMATIDTVVIGRKTFETVLSLPEWPYGGKRVVVLSNHAIDLSLVEIVTKLATEGARHLYVDGGITIQSFLRDCLIQRIIITRVPVLIGSGIPLFGPLERDIRLRHVATQYYASGLVKTEYQILYDQAKEKR